MTFKKHALTTALVAALTAPAAALALEVNITPDMASVDVTVDGKKVTIMRDQNQDATVIADFAKTSRKCPPFCIQPGELGSGVETIGEVEVLEYLKKKEGGDESILVVDSRTPDWVAKGTIPGAVNIPWTELNIGKSDPITVAEILEGKLGAKQQDGFWNFENAKTLVMFCNGPWCGQSPTNIKGLLKIGYPGEKIKWYRGGMQDWNVLGLTTIPGGK